jgi:hypothetical protein
MVESIHIRKGRMTMELNEVVAKIEEILDRYIDPEVGGDHAFIMYEVRRMSRQLQKAQDWQKGAVEVLRKVEWMKEIRRGHVEDRCNCCRGWESHFEDCALAALLKEVDQ